MVQLVAGCLENELGIRKFLEDRGHTLVVTDDKEGPDSQLDKELPDTDIVRLLPNRAIHKQVSYLLRQTLYVLHCKCSGRRSGACRATIRDDGMPSITKGAIIVDCPRACQIKLGLHR